MDEPSSYLTTFNSPFGRYRFQRLPFGLNLSQDVFQERLDQILEHCEGTIGIADDVAVLNGKNEADDDENLHNLMITARQPGLVFNAEKCNIKQQRMQFFGLIFDSDGVHPDPGKIIAIRQLQDATQLKEFLGIATYMSTFTPYNTGKMRHTTPASESASSLLKMATRPALDGSASHQPSLICNYVISC